MAFEATWINGAIIPDAPLPLPDGTRLEVVPTSPPSVGLFGFLVGAIDDLPADFAAEHDHYIHGTPRRQPKAES